MSESNGLRPPVKVHHRIVLGIPTYVIEVGKEEVAFDRIEDIVHRLVRHFETPQEKKTQVKKPAMTEWIVKSVKKPMTTDQVFKGAKKAGFPDTTKDSVYAALWHLEKKKIFSRGEDRQKWAPKK